MKKFLYKMIILTLPFFVINLCYVSTNYWKSENNVRKFNSVPEGIQLANLGPSHTEFGLLYNDFSQYKAFNFALSAQPYFWDYSILQQYHQNFVSNAVILLPICYFMVNARTDDYNQIRPRYYRFLERKYFDKWNAKEFIQYAKFPILSAGNKLFKIFNDIPVEEIDVFNTRTDHLEYDELLEYCQQKYDDATAPEFDKGEEGYQQNLAEVCQLVNLCLDKGLQPVLITVPITTVLNDIYAEQSPNFFPTFYRFISDVQTQFPNVPYFDYSHDTEFSPKFELFADGDHLNVYGAREFTAHVVADLQEAGLLQ